MHEQIRYKLAIQNKGYPNRILHGPNDEIGVGTNHMDINRMDDKGNHLSNEEHFPNDHMDIEDLNRVANTADFIHNLLPVNVDFNTHQLDWARDTSGLVNHQPGTSDIMVYHTPYPPRRSRSSISTPTPVDDPETMLNHRIVMANNHLLEHIHHSMLDGNSFSPQHDEVQHTEHENPYIRNLTNYIVHDAPHLVKEFHDAVINETDLWNGKDDLHDRFYSWLQNHEQHSKNQLALDYQALLEHVKKHGQNNTE